MVTMKDGQSSIPLLGSAAAVVRNADAALAALAVLAKAVVAASAAQ
jgi:hypothetical protein